MKHHINVGPFFGRDLKIFDIFLFGPFFSFVFWYHSPMAIVAFISNQDTINIFTTFLSISQPPFGVFKCFSVCQIKAEYCCMCVSVKMWSDSSKPFLARCIPHL